MKQCNACKRIYTLEELKKLKLQSIKTTIDKGIAWTVGTVTCKCGETIYYEESSKCRESA